MHIKHLLLSLFLVAFTIDCVFAQEDRPENPWGKFIKTPVKKNDVARKTTNYTLIKLTQDITTHDLVESGYQLIRRLDKEYAIVLHKGPISPTLRVGGEWLVNDQWKLGLKLSNERVVNTKSYKLFVKTLQKNDWLLEQEGITVKKVIDQYTYIISAKGQAVLNTLLPNNNIYYIGIESQSPKTDSRVLDLNLNVNTVNLVHNKFPQYEGQGIVASIQEQKFKTDDIDIRGRTISSSLSSNIETNHATEMATIVAGAGNSFVNGRGVVSQAKITSSDFVDVLPDPDNSYTDLAVSVQNHSYGTEIENFYGAEAEAFDKSANNNEQLLHVLSSGNLGMEQDTSGTYQGVVGFANLSGNYKMAKNNLVIGSVDTVGRLISFVSNGPAYDGRVKPELVTYSTAGSSNSAALASGVIALLQQAYKDLNGTLPPSALIKALLINSAHDVYNKGIDFKTGYGDLDSYRTLQNLLAQQYFEGTVTHQQTTSFNITVPANTENLKITLVWNDPAATPNANIALVNDLDLSTDYMTTTWQPWVLDPTADASTLDALATRGTDHLNNVEQITIQNPAAGDYSVNINGFDIPQGSQTFYIAYQWDNKDQFNWTYPTASDNMPYDGETGSYFRWNSTLTMATGLLEYSLDGGTSWTLIDDQVDLSKGHYRWETPIVNSKALARITAGGTTYTTDTFSISSPLALKVGFNCSDSLLLQWDKVANANNYTLYSMGNQYLQSFTTTSDTSLVVYKSDFPTRYFSLQPHLIDGSDIIRSYTIDYNLQGTSCFLTSFYTTAENEKLFLNLKLGSLYGVKEVVFERFVNNAYQEIDRFSPSSQTIVIEEPSPIQGLNVHRAKITFDNGAEIITEDSYTYFLTNKPFLVFPNPLQPGDELNVYSKNFVAGTVREFMLYNRTGQLVKKETILSSRGYIDTFGLKPGLYLYKVKAGSYEETGKVVIIE